MEREKLCIYNESCQKRLNRVLNASKEKYEITLDVTEADWVIFVACASTDNMFDVIDQELEEVFGAKKDSCKVIFTGCMLFAKESKRTFLNKYAIDYFVPVKNQVEDICEILNITPSETIFNQYQIFGRLEIGDGCLNKCSFCRIHYCNREFYSIPMEEVEKVANDLINHGIKILSFISLNTAQYGLDLYGRKMLHVLLKRVSKIPGIECITIESLSLSDMYDELIKEIIENNLIRSVSIDMQSGSDKILKLMNVGHDVQRIREVFKLLGKKIGFSRIISGFPGETEEDVMRTIKLLKELKVRRIDVSRYMDSVDTPSGKLEQLSEEEADQHYLLYKKAVKEIEEKLLKKLNGKYLIGYIYDFSVDFMTVYCPEYRYVGILMKEEYLSFNLNDRVLVKVVDGNFFFDRVLESVTVETEPKFNVSKNEFINYLMNHITITEDYAIKRYELNNKCRMLYESLGGKNLSRDEFKEQISWLPDGIVKTWMMIYENLHN